MNNLSCFLLLLTISSAPMNPDYRSPYEVITQEGRYCVIDGSSFYSFEKDGDFRSGPVGMSGRMIHGRWTFREPSVFTIEGQWSWMNGLSPDGDFRRMRLIIPSAGTCVDARSVSPMLFAQGEVYSAYIVVDELVSIPRPGGLE